jgi:hypothetical protein
MRLNDSRLVATFFTFLKAGPEDGRLSFVRRLRVIRRQVSAQPAVPHDQIAAAIR